MSLENFEKKRKINQIALVTNSSLILIAILNLFVNSVSAQPAVSNEGVLPVALFTVSRVTAIDHGRPLGHASGFFFRSKANKTYFVTNKHVVKPWASAASACTDLMLTLHSSNTDITQSRDYKLALQNKNGKNIFFEHRNPHVDVVLIPITDPPFTEALIKFISPDWFFDNKTFAVGIGEEAVVVGYPLGFSDQRNNLPIFRHATIASTYGVDFDGLPICLIDANLQHGMSGSPIFTTPANTRINRKGEFRIANSGLNAYSFLGLLSRKVPVPVEKGTEEVGLNDCWYPEILNQIATDAESIDQSTVR